MEPRTITTLSFSMVGTLIDLETGICEWFRAHLRDHDRPADDAGLLAAFGEARGRLDREQEPASFTSLLPRIYREIAREWELDTDEAAALDFRDSIRDWPAFADAVSGLRRLHEHYRLVGVTHADRWAAEAMSHTLADAFDVLVSVETTGTARTGSGTWEALLAQVDAKPGEILHCASSPRQDLAGARAAGLATAWIERRAGDDESAAIPADRPATEPDLRVPDLATLFDCLQAPSSDRAG